MVEAKAWERSMTVLNMGFGSIGVHPAATRVKNRAMKFLMAHLLEEESHDRPPSPPVFQKESGSLQSEIRKHFA